MNKKILIISAIVMLLISIVALISKYHFTEQQDIVLMDTATVIESSKPIGVLYLFTAITEDWAKGSFMGSGIGSSVLGEGKGLLKKKHDCYQILKQQVNFTIDLNKVFYEILETSDTVYVTLPKVEFSQSTLGSWFKSDNENEEAVVKYDAKPLIKEVETKIRNRYCTEENTYLAQQRAKKTISEFLKQCGKTAVFR